jgi:hypothetical protein
MRSFKFASLAFIALFFSGILHAQTADEVINKHLEAIGGKENWKKVNSFKMEANISVQGNDIPVTIYQVHNKASKSEINFQGTVNYNIITTEGGWKFFPIMGQASPEPMTEDELKVGRDQLDIQGDFLDYAAKGHKVELIGKEAIDGVDAYKIRLTRKNGSETVYLIDSKTNYIARAISKVKANGQEMEQTTILSNYQKLPEGIVIPFSMEGVGPAPIVISKVEVNPAIDQAIFKVSQ